MFFFYIWFVHHHQNWDFPSHFAVLEARGYILIVIYIFFKLPVYVLFLLNILSLFRLFGNTSLVWGGNGTVNLVLVKTRLFKWTSQHQTTQQTRLPDLELKKTTRTSRQLNWPQDSLGNPIYNTWTRNSPRALANSNQSEWTSL